MKQLRDQLLKAGLVDKKKIKQAQHQDRIKGKKTKARERAHEKRQKEQMWHKEQEEKRRQDKLRSQSQHKIEKNKEDFYRIRDIVTSSAVQRAFGGKRKFYFVTRQNTVSSVFVSDPVGFKLEKGEYCIVSVPESDEDNVVIVPRNTALKLEDLEPSLILFFNR